MLMSAPQNSLIAALKGEDKAAALSAVAELDNVEFYAEGQMPLHFASAKPWPEVVEAILAKCKPDSSQYKTTTGKTALHIAQANDQLAVAECLVRYNRSLRTIGDRQGKTPLHEAARDNKMEFLTCYLALHVDGVHIPCNVNVQDKQLCTPLHDAVRGLHLEATQLLLANDANAQLCDESASKPQAYLSLMLALQHDEKSTLKLQQMLTLLKGHTLPPLFSLAACTSADSSTAVPGFILEQATQAVTFARDNQRQEEAARAAVLAKRIKASKDIEDAAKLKVLEVRFASLGFN